MPIVGLYVVHDLSNTIWSFLMSASNTTACTNALLAGATPGSPIVRPVVDVHQNSVAPRVRYRAGAERARRVIRILHASKAAQELGGQFVTHYLLLEMPIESPCFTLVVLERAQIELNV